MNTGIYVRMSLDEAQQSDYSLGAQERACRAYIEAQGWTVAGVYADEDVSGTRFDRPALQRLLTDMRAGRIQAVLVHKLDRLARSVRIANDLIEEFQRRKIAFVAVADKIDLSTPYGWAAFQIQSVWNELYIKNLSFETSKGHTEKARRGLWVGPVPYGYTRHDRTLAPSADAPVVVLIFEWYATGNESYASIADKLNALGHRTLDWKTQERRLFGRESIRTILRNRAYCGYVSAGGVEYHGVHPPLISEELWQQGNNVRSERTIAGGAVKLAPVDIWVLQGLVYCAVCGAKMWIHPSGPKHHRQRNYFCSGRSRRTCAAAYVHARPIEEAMIALLGSLLITSELEDAILAETRRLFETERPAPAVDRDQITAQLGRLGEAYADGTISKAKYTQRRDALRAQLASLPALAAPVFDVSEAVRLLRAFPAFVASSSVEGLREMLGTVFSHVWAEGKQITAVTPKGVYLPLLATLWQSSLGCPTGFEPATS